jgi:aryl-alcohol dehydrogenase-like predicted oxidoreductase
MPIRDMQRFIELTRAGDHTIPQRVEVLEAHRDALAEQLALLNRHFGAIERQDLGVPRAPRRSRNAEGVRVKTVELGRTGEQVSQLSLGCMIMGTSTDEATAVRMLDHYIEAGGNFLDTANCYCWWHRPGSQGGESEELLGRWLHRSGRRDDVFLATKGSGMVWDQDGVWTEGAEPDWELARARFEGAGAKTLKTAIDASLRDSARTTSICTTYTLMIVSTPLEETLQALADIVAAGKARYIGWSNVRTWRLERIRQLCERHGWPAPVALQQQHSYLRRQAGLDHGSIVDVEQLDYLREHDDLTLVAYSPILKGIYDDPAKQAGHWMMSSYEGPDSDARLATVQGSRIGDRGNAKPDGAGVADATDAGHGSADRPADVRTVTSPRCRRWISCSPISRPSAWTRPGPRSPGSAGTCSSVVYAVPASG